VPAPSALEESQRLFFTGRYEDSANLALDLRNDPQSALASYELRTSALHLQIKRALGPQRDRKAALAACPACPRLLSELTADIAAGRAAARARLRANHGDDEARFFLGKIDLTHVWLHLETLGRRTGWSEYWEARRSLDDVLERRPDHLRAVVSRAWIDYIVDTRVPWSVRWMLGGGDKKGAIAAVTKAAAAKADPFVVAEARFALWDMLNREGRRDEALVVARELYRAFPDNQDLAKAVR
jgi:hypothetical protein